ncbi:ABC transporter permease [Georgenia alba]|uniref:ABC transporter permease n=1 Tax=Georgenia alba TaxID=2233858 RepID=A0ABW2Q6C2_9MICO
MSETARRTPSPTRSGADAGPLRRLAAQAGSFGGAVAILAALVLVFSLVTDEFLTVDNLLNILRQYAVVLILAVGQTLVIITAGIDLSVAATAALSGSIMGVAYAHLGLSEAVAIGLGLLSGFAVGLLNGLAVAVLKVPDIIVTLGSLTAVRGVALVLTDGLPVPDFAQAIEGRRIPEPVATLGAGNLGRIPLIIVVALVCCAIGWYVLNRTRLGRSIVAVGGNRQAAHVSGISVARTKIAVYAFSGLLAGVAGMMLAGRLSSANALMGELLELDTIAAVVIGGTALYGGQGRVSGTIIGVFIIGVLANGLNILGVSDFWQRIITGVIIVAVVALDQWRRRRSST